jgi:RNA polymerase sigma-70 factor (ECF subfamily)
MALPTPSTDEDLFQRLRKGDESAFVNFYRRWNGKLFRYGLRMSGSVEVAEDVVQEFFLALIREAHGYDPQRGSLSSYLYGIARHKTLRFLQKQRSWIPLETEHDDEQDLGQPGVRMVAEQALADLLRKERIEMVWTHDLALPVKYREAVILCDLQEMSYEEAAGTLECPVGTVRSRLHRVGR